MPLRHSSVTDMIESKIVHREWPLYTVGVEYAEQVVAGEIVVGKWIKLACEKFLTEYNDPDFYWQFNASKVQDVVDFCFFVPHVQGEMEGEPTCPNPWQIWILCSMFGWYRGDKRRYEQSIVEVARKNGKSFICSLFAVYELLMGDPGAEIYSVATKRDQAKKVWQDAVQMTKKMDSRISKQFNSTVTNLYVQKRYSKYTAVGRDSDSLDGLNPSMVIIDEAAAIKDRNLVGVMTTGLGGRLNPMVIYITTAQFTKETVYYDKRTYAQQILSGMVTVEPEDDTMFAAIYCIDEDDDFTHEEIWHKANPNLAFLPSIGRTIKTSVKEALAIPAEKNNVLVKHFNVFTNTDAAWIDVDHWEKSAVDKITREGKMFISFDLSKVDDLTAASRMWCTGDSFHIDFQCWMPRKKMRDLPVDLKSIFEQAVESGILRLTDGETVDYRELIQFIDNSVEQYDVHGIAYDDWNAGLVVSELTERGYDLYKIGQSQKAMSSPSKETEKHIIDKLIKHDGNPFITWQLSNCVANYDLNNNLKVKKPDDRKLKIDSIVCLIMAMSLGAGMIDEPVTEDVWFLT